jgi:hypothetical protein
MISLEATGMKKMVVRVRRLSKKEVKDLRGIVLG